MKKYVLLIFILISCKSENKYEIALNEYLKEDLHFKQSRINSQLERLRMKTEEQPLKYTVLYKEATFLNKHCLDFERKALNINSNSLLNTLYDKLKDSIKKRKYSQNRFIAREIEKLPNRIDNTIDKYNILRRLKEFNYMANHLVDGYDLSKFSCNLGISKSSVLAVRINKNQVALNVYSELVSLYPDYFDDESFNFIKLKDPNNNIIPILRDNKDIIKSIIIETQSDTIFMDATIQTKKDIGLLVSENKSSVIVGKLKNFDKNHFKEYIEFYLNK